MAFFSKSLRNWTKKHDFIEGLTERSPTEYAELTEITAEFSPTEYAECTEFTAEFFPTEYAELVEFITEYSPTDFRSILGGALVSSAPTKQTVILPQISQIYTDG